MLAPAYSAMQVPEPEPEEIESGLSAEEYQAMLESFQAEVTCS